MRGTEGEEEGGAGAQYMAAAFVSGFSSLKEGKVYMLDSVNLKRQYAIFMIVRFVKK